MTLLSISSCSAALLYFTDSKSFSNSSKLRSWYSIFFFMGNRNSSNYLDVFSILLARFGPIFVKHFSAFIWFLCNVTILFYRLSINIYWFRISVRVSFIFSRDFFHYLPRACYVILRILKYRLIVCLLSFFT